MGSFILVAFGGAAGAVSRYAIALAVSGHHWPWSTFLVNVLGSIGFGLVMVLLVRGSLHQTLQPLLMVGFFGAFTTFSTFSWEVFQFIERNAWLDAVSYSLVSVVSCVLGITVGIALARLAG